MSKIKKGIKFYDAILIDLCLNKKYKIKCV